MSGHRTVLCASCRRRPVGANRWSGTILGSSNLVGRYCSPCWEMSLDGELADDESNIVALFAVRMHRDVDRYEKALSDILWRWLKRDRPAKGTGQKKVAAVPAGPRHVSMPESARADAVSHLNSPMRLESGLSWQSEIKDDALLARKKR